MNHGPIQPLVEMIQAPAPGTGPRTFVYGRVSSDKQDTMRQIDENKRMVESHPVLQPVFMEEYDEAVSGRLDFSQRPVGRKFMAHFQKGDRLVFDRIARLSRSYRGGLEVCWELGQDRGVELWLSNAEGIPVPIDVQTHLGQFMLSVMMFSAAQQWEHISKQTKEAFRARRARGLPNNSQPGYGFTLAGEKPHRRIVRVEHEQANLDRIWELYNGKGYGARMIARMMNEAIDALPEDQKYLMMYRRQRHQRRVNGVLVPIEGCDQHGRSRWDMRAVEHMLKKLNADQKQRDLADLAAAAEVARERGVLKVAS